MQSAVSVLHPLIFVWPLATTLFWIYYRTHESFIHRQSSNHIFHPTFSILSPSTAKPFYWIGVKIKIKVNRSSLTHDIVYSLLAYINAIFMVRMKAVDWGLNCYNHIARCMGVKNSVHNSKKLRKMCSCLQNRLN